MIFDNLQIILEMFFRPHRAMSNVLDKGSWIFGAIGVLVISAIFQFTINTKINDAYGVPKFNAAAYDENNDDQFDAALEKYQESMQNRQKLPLVGDLGLKFFSFDSNFFTILISLAVFYVPGTILLLAMFSQIGSFSLLLRKDYGTLLACTLLGWTAAHLPFAIAGILLDSQKLDPNIYLVLWLVSGLFFGVLMVFALRTAFGLDFIPAILTICVSWLSMSAGTYILGFISPWLFSPFLLFYAYFYFGGQISGEATAMNNSFRQRQNFQRFLKNSLVNPKDADAHLQLGLIYKQRRQIDEASKHFEKAFEIDPNEIDANFELGKIARQKGDLQKAINHFSVVVEQNEKFSVNEIWREIGATYLNANMLAEAHEALEKFVARRSSDTEGLYYFGKVLVEQGEKEKAREIFTECVESYKTSPDYRQYEQRKWSRLAKKALAEMN